jgi:hypothetical protein
MDVVLQVDVGKIDTTTWVNKASIATPNFQKTNLSSPCDFISRCQSVKKPFSKNLNFTGGFEPIDQNKGIQDLVFEESEQME